MHHVTMQKEYILCPMCATRVQYALCTKPSFFQRDTLNNWYSIRVVRSSIVLNICIFTQENEMWWPFCFRKKKRYHCVWCLNHCFVGTWCIYLYYTDNILYKCFNKSTHKIILNGTEKKITGGFRNRGCTLSVQSKSNIIFLLIYIYIAGFRKQIINQLVILSTSCNRVFKIQRASCRLLLCGYINSTRF